MSPRVVQGVLLDDPGPEWFPFHELTQEQSEAADLFHLLGVAASQQLLRTRNMNGVVWLSIVGQETTSREDLLKLAGEVKAAKHAAEILKRGQHHETDTELRGRVAQGIELQHQELVRRLKQSEGKNLDELAAAYGITRRGP